MILRSVRWVSSALSKCVLKVSVDVRSIVFCGRAFQSFIVSGKKDSLNGVDELWNSVNWELWPLLALRPG